MTSTSNVNNNADDNNDGSKYNDYDEMIYREKDAINTGTSGAETYSLKHHHPEDVSPPSPFVKNGRWIDSRMTSENESEHRRMAGMSTMHADHVSSLHRLQDYHRSIMQEACDIDHVLEEAKDIMFQAKSMVVNTILIAYSLSNDYNNQIVNFNTNVLGQRCVALKFDQPHEITKKQGHVARQVSP